MRQFARHFFIFLLVSGLCLPILAGCGSDEEDISAPAVTLDSLHSQNDNLTGTPAFKIDGGTTSLELSGTVEAGALVEVEVNAAEPVAATVTDTDWDYTLDASVLEEGSNTVVVSAEDSVGNKRSLTFFLIRDTTGPNITFDQFVTPDVDGSQTIGGTVDVGSTVSVFVDDDVAGVPAEVEGPLWSFDLDLSALADGSHDVSVIGYDELGNPSSEVVVPIVKDATALLLTVDQSLLEWTADTATTVGGSLGDALTLTLSPAATTALIENQTITTSDDPDSWSADFVNLESGVNLLAVVVDDGSASAEAQAIVYRDLGAPAVIGNSPAHGAAVDVPPSEVTVTFSEDMDSGSINITDVATAESPSMTLVDAAGELIDGDVTYNSVTRTATYTLDPLVSGETYTVTVKSTVTDELGNPMGTVYAWTFETK